MRAADRRLRAGTGCRRGPAPIWARGAQWVPESVPVRAVGRASDGTVTDVVLDVAGMAWFERLLLQLGTDASVVRPPELTDLAATSRPQGLEYCTRKT